ncbi:MAG: hypothetical protein V2J14_08180 [Erythrobacter sp.]|jgi:hypothetical protein|nr:hypothetical protein [Erythrobacter sp.]
MSSRATRRSTLITRQLALARIARREALAGLAGALAEERRSHALAARSRDMAAGYAGRAKPDAGIEPAGALTGRLRFAGALERLAGDAEARGFEAGREAEWHARALAGAERRLEVLETRAAEARRAAEAARDRRMDASADAQTRALARKLQIRS